ncbi:MAG: hypothetical protein C4B59_07505 [Candidatus Methanogaster sp.]|uniref:Uncharacterized protein n=1 Tax=Candidatus Methanogaster sp. TaxID=3386292 RepID=A0AC61L3M8_9EURY|nr:MAG: hypothetical protein C4B59_07505 [ANME-2 cluster archaeon]
MFEVYLSSKSLKTLQKFDKQIAERIKKFLLNLKISPLPVKNTILKRLAACMMFTGRESQVTELFMPSIGRKRKST